MLYLGLGTRRRHFVVVVMHEAADLLFTLLWLVTATGCFVQCEAMGSRLRCFSYIKLVTSLFVEHNAGLSVAA